MKPIEDLSAEEFEPLLRRAVALEDPPAALVRKALDAWQNRTVSLQEAAGAIARRVSAVLGFDSWSATPTAFGMRDAPSESRQLVFTALGRDVDLRISPAANGVFEITGQVLGPDESGTVTLMPQAVAGATAAAPLIGALDALGEFRIEGVAAGTWLVTISVGGDEIALPAIDVGERQR